jgi:Zn finger protein HypA/HybF involved in hydrogenase expression
MSDGWPSPQNGIAKHRLFDYRMTTQNKPADRTCLSCRKVFRSLSAANRICKRCTSKRPEASGVEQKVVSTVPNRTIKDVGDI